MGLKVRAPKKMKARSHRAGPQNPGSVLLSHKLAPAVPSALESLTCQSLGIGTGRDLSGVATRKKIKRGRASSAGMVSGGQQCALVSAIVRVD